MVPSTTLPMRWRYTINAMPWQHSRQRPCVYAYRVMMSEKPSTHCLYEPETPAMLYPRGGINVCLYQSGVSKYVQWTAWVSGKCYEP